MPTNDTLNVVHPRAAGLDVHKMQITASVCLARPRARAEILTETFSALPRGLSRLVAWLLRHGVTDAVMEGTGIYWQAPFEALEAAGIQPHLMNAQMVKQIKGRKTDVKDSVWLATIGQFGLGTPSMIPPTRFRRLRQISRLRRALIQDGARLRNRIHKVLDAAGIRIQGVISDLFGVNGLRILDGIVAGKPPEAILGSLSPHVRPHLKELHDALSARLDEESLFLLTDLLEAWHQTRRRLVGYDAAIERGLSEFPETIELLITIPGIDRESAAAILIELGPDIRVFRSRRHCAAWAGLCPGNNESAGKQRRSQTRRGNTTLREVLIECAHGAARTQDTQFEGYRKALSIRRGQKRATVATAHKMLRVIHSMLRSGRSYRDLVVSHEKLMLRRNAPRWIRKLREYGHMPPPPAEFVTAPRPETAHWLAEHAS